MEGDATNAALVDWNTAKTPRIPRPTNPPWAAYQTTPKAFFEHWRWDQEEAGKPLPTTAAEVEARVKKTLADAGYSGLPGEWRIPPPGSNRAFSRRKHHALISKARTQITRLGETLGKLEKTDTIGLDRRVGELKVLAAVEAGQSEDECRKAAERGWFNGENRQRYAGTLTEIERELEWRDKGVSGQRGRPQDKMVNEWTIGFRRCGLSDERIAGALKVLGLEGAGNASDRVRQRRRRHK
jgi:hypothetical protein